jgi:hypothetical protein
MDRQPAAAIRLVSLAFGEDSDYACPLGGVLNGHIAARLPEGVRP